ncbi:MAG: hypothetical protein ABWW70_00800, partial [Thermoproteota archaeon]
MFLLCCPLQFDGDLQPCKKLVKVLYREAGNVIKVKACSRWGLQPSASVSEILAKPARPSLREAARPPSGAWRELGKAPLQLFVEASVK